ncbi:hypothetical protein FV232_21235, partial [Methylobacterium sp. WL30]
PEHNAPKPPCPSWKPVIPNQPVGGPPQRWEASKPPPIPCQPRLRHRRNPDPTLTTDKNSRAPGFHRPAQPIRRR